jgi:ketosteroid isomerase-like protein
MSDTDDIRELITRWVDAVQSCDLEGVLARHHPAIVMFDVPPPYDGIRGIDDYRDSWSPFFE